MVETMEALDDPFAGLLERSTVAQALRHARASLARPTRPITPMDRSLFQCRGGFDTSRPSSGYSISSLKFVGDTFSSSGSLASTAASMSSTLRSSRLSESCTPIQEYEEVENLDPDYNGSTLADVATFDEHGDIVGEYHGQCPSGDIILPIESSFELPSRDSYTSSGKSKKKKSKKEKKSKVHPEAEEYEFNDAHDLALFMDVPLPSDDSEREDELRKSKCRGKHHGNDQGGEAARMWLASFQKTIAELEACSSGSDAPLSSASLESMIQQVWKLIADLRGKRKAQRAQASKLLRALLGLMDKKGDALGLLRLARCIMEVLSMQSVRDDVGSSGAQAAQLNVAKALFKLSKEDSHDDHFVQEGLIDSLLGILCNTGDRASLLELWLFTLGTLRNVTNSENSQLALSKAGALPVLQTLLELEGMSPCGASGGKEAQLLVQALGLLRNLAMPSEGHYEFLELGVLPQLLSASARYPLQEDMQVNYARILSRLSEDEGICEALCEDEMHLHRILDCMKTHAGVQRLVLRLAFVMGNLTGGSDRVRTQFMFNFGGAALLEELATHYWQRDRKLAQVEASSSLCANGERGEEAGECEEVLVKLVRVVANTAMNEAAGQTLAASAPIVNVLLDVLGCKRMPESEELVLNVVSAITNLTFYDTPDNLLLAPDNAELVCRQLRPLMLESYNAEALSEAARALGNLSRRADARQWIRELRIDEVLAILLGHDDRDLVLYSCGTLVNMAAEGSCIGRHLCSTQALHMKLASVLNDAPDDDGDLICVAVKLLANLCIGQPTEAASFEEPIHAEWGSTQLRAVSAGLERVCASPELAETVAAQPGLMDLANRLLEFLVPP